MSVGSRPGAVRDRRCASGATSSAAWPASRVLDAVLDDLYGARRLLLDGVIPTAAVMGSRAYQLAAVGVAVPRPRLMLYAADLVRDSSGRWLLLRDHTDAPTGCGYALMNRTVLSRLYPEPFRHLGVSPLSGWFADLRTALSAVAPPDVTGPRTILLGPNPQRPGFVEASYLAAHLGYHLASSGDLITRGGRVWLRTLGGLEQIDVVFRRLADTGSDPLELRPVRPGRRHRFVAVRARGQRRRGQLARQRGGRSIVAAAVPRRRGPAPARRDAGAGVDRHVVVRRSRQARRGARRPASVRLPRHRSCVARRLGVRRRALRLRRPCRLARPHDRGAASVCGPAEDRVRQHTRSRRRRTAQRHGEHSCADRADRRRSHRAAGRSRSPCRCRVNW